jgi:predicted phage terminase large subunit-like protein
VVIQTRWHEDDLAGWLIKEHAHEGWEVLNLPALAEPGDPLGRSEGDALWPEAYPVEELAVIRRSVGSRDWSALYQQRPTAAEGGLFKREHWRYFKPKENEPKALVQSLGCFQVIQAWDTAFKTKEANDYSVGVTIGISPNRYYVLDCWRDRLEFPELKRAIQAQAMKWGAHAVLIEDAAAGQSLLQEMQRNTRLPLIPVKADRDKVSRANAVTPSHEAGLVYLPEDAAWLADFLDELASFPSAPHDDQVDALVHGLTWAMKAQAPEIEEPEEEFYGRASGMGWLA